MRMGYQAYPEVNVASQEVATEKEVMKIKAAIKATIVAEKGGMPVVSLREAYYQTMDEDIPVENLGYSSLLHLIRDIPEIKIIKNNRGESVFIVSSNKTKHLIEMIEKQKDPKIYSRKSKSYKIDKKQKKINRQKDYDMYRNTLLEKSIPHLTKEKCGKPIIDNDPFCDNNKMVCTEPILGSHQLVGDDYFLQICIKYLNHRLVRKNEKSAISCGTVKSGLTIKQSTKGFEKFKIISNKLIINVGTVDIYNRRQISDMIKDYEELLKKIKEKFFHSPHQITVCTLPPMGNVGIYSDNMKYVTFMSFNTWLRNFAKKNGYRLLDLYNEFTNDNMVLNFDYFQQDARHVSGTMHPHVLWNYFGRQRVMKLILDLK